MRFLYLMLLPMIGAAFMRFYEDRGKFNTSLLFKSCSSAVFVLLGFLSYRISARTTPALLILIALIFGALGDILLKWFFVGASVFFAGHFFNLAAILPMIRGHVFQAAILAVCAAGIVSLLMYTHFKEAQSFFKILSSLYLLAVIAVAAFGIVRFIVNPITLSSTLFMIGGVCFAASDVIIIADCNLKEHNHLLQTILIYLYYIGQCLIAMSIQGL